MKKYIITGVVVFLIVVIANSFIFLNKVDPVIILTNAFFCVIICAVVVSFFSVLVRFLPKKLFRYDNILFRTYKWEEKFYNFLHIKSWKEKIPEMGKTGGFAKNKVDKPKDKEYLEKFLQENCIAEFIHVNSVIINGLLFIFLPVEYHITIGIPIFLLAGYLNILPAFVQRYLRPKLLVLYKHAIRLEERAKKKAMLSEEKEKCDNI